MDGVEFCRRKASNPALAEVPVVVISAIADATRLPAESGIRATFPKPITIEQLLRCIDIWGGSARIGN
jgi:CheY-like chemotaxis protein